MLVKFWYYYGAVREGEGEGEVREEGEEADVREVSGDGDGEEGLSYRNMDWLLVFCEG